MWGTQSNDNYISGFTEKGEELHQLCPLQLAEPAPADKMITSLHRESAVASYNPQCYRTPHAFNIRLQCTSDKVHWSNRFFFLFSHSTFGSSKLRGALKLANPSFGHKMHGSYVNFDYLHLSSESAFCAMYGLKTGLNHFQGCATLRQIVSSNSHASKASVLDFGLQIQTIKKIKILEIVLLVSQTVLDDRVIEHLPPGRQNSKKKTSLSEPYLLLYIKAFC